MTGGTGGVPGTIARYLATALLTVVAVVLLLVTTCGAITLPLALMDRAFDAAYLGFISAILGGAGLFATVAALRRLRPRAPRR